jgi:uncharacterized membrane protein
MSLALLVHLLGVVVWVGGMFFAHVALRPSAAQLLEPPARLPLLAATLGRFFAWVVVAVVAILASGFGLVAGMGGFRAVGAHVHAMTGIGLLMAAIFAYIRLVPYPRLRAAVVAKTWPTAGAAMGTVRRLVAVNLLLGIATIVIAVVGPAMAR